MHGEEEIKLLYTTAASSDAADAGKRLKDDDPSCRAHGSSDFQDGLARGEKKKTVGFLFTGLDETLGPAGEVKGPAERR